MNDINLISEYIDFSGKSILDVGCNSGFFCKIFLNKKLEVTAIDHKDLLDSDLKKNLTFKLIKLEKFNSEFLFDIIFAKDVFSFSKKKLNIILEQYLKMLKINGIIFFTYFNDKEIWVNEKKVIGISRKKIEKLLENLDDKKYEQIYFGEEIFQGLTMNKSLKKWHKFKIILKRIK